MAKSFSGKFVLRISKELHSALKKRAVKDGVSLNSLCADALQKNLAGGHPDALKHTSAIMTPIIDALQESLLGLLLFGSFARGEQRGDSDMDLLIIVTDDTPLDRGLYTLWDEKVADWTGDRLSPHFVHIPERIEDAGSIWLEAAIDGLILHDSDHAVGRFLAGLRKAILDGMFRRRRAYGLPYWLNMAKEADRVQ